MLRLKRSSTQAFPQVLPKKNRHATLSPSEENKSDTGPRESGNPTSCKLLGVKKDKRLIMTVLKLHGRAN